MSRAPKIVILYFEGGLGWQPISYMAHLAANLLEADIIGINANDINYSKINALSSLLGSKSGIDFCLIIAPSPPQLYSLFNIVGWQKRFCHVSAWVIDSFWHERIPFVFKHFPIVDKYYVMNPEDVKFWERYSNNPIGVLPWGSDVYQLGWRGEYKDIDILRVGRQPDAWTDDDISKEAAKKYGLSFFGRPPIKSDPIDSQNSLISYMKRARVVVAFSNKINPTGYTKKGVEYVTGRWTDSLSSGALIAGKQPKCDVVSRYFVDPWAINIDGMDIENDLAVISDRLSSIDRDISNDIFSNALKNLDWRWRFKSIVSDMGLESCRLDRDLEAMSSLLTGGAGE